jgi:hypothetical protein
VQAGRWLMPVEPRMSTARGPVAGPSGSTSMTIGAATAVDAVATSTIVACFVRYHGAGGALNVSVLLFEVRSCLFTVHVLTVGVASRRGGGAGAGSASCGASSGSSRTFLAGAQLVVCPAINC